MSYSLTNISMDLFTDALLTLVKMQHQQRTIKTGWQWLYHMYTMKNLAKLYKTDVIHIKTWYLNQITSTQTTVVLNTLITVRLSVAHALSMAPSTTILLIRLDPLLWIIYPLITFCCIRIVKAESRTTIGMLTHFMIGKKPES